MKTDQNDRSGEGRKKRRAPRFGPDRRGPGKAAGGAPNGAASGPGPKMQRYLALARAAEAAGDAVQSEYYYQHAEHYLREMQPRG